MWKLCIEDDQANRTTVALVRDEYSLGRAEDNAVRLTERNISRKHAVLKRNGTGWVVEDLNSYNGCYVNGVRVSGTHKLEHGDLVQLGDYRLEITDEAVPTATAASSKAATMPAAPRSQILLGQPDRLVMLVGPTPGVEYPLIGERLVIGRGEECNVVINHGSVSRVHAEIHPLGDGRYEILDRESANGVRVNGVDLERGILDARDIIELGDIQLKFIPRGMIYRPGADESQQIEAVAPGLERLTPAPGVEGVRAPPGAIPPGLKIAGAIAAIGLVVLIGIVASRGSRSDANLGSAPARVEAANRALDQAKKLLDQGEIEQAHQLVLREVPEDSNARKSDTFQRIEAAWADMLLGKAAKESDPNQKRELYDRVAKASSVDSVRRKRASNEIAALDGEGVEVTDLPGGRVADGGAGKKLVGGLIRKNPYGAGAPAAPPEEPPPEEPPPQPTAAATPTGSPGSGSIENLMTSGNRVKAARAKAMLEAKANSGKATVQELRQLKALCGQLGDAACRARAQSLLNSKQNE